MMSILVPEKASGLIIGHGGESIRSMVEQSGSKIQLTSKDKQPPGLDERILVCTGTLPQVKVGCALIVMKICEDPNATYTNMTTLYSRYNGGAAAQAAMGGMGMAGMGAYSGMSGMAGLIGMPGMDAYSAQMGQLGQMDPYAGYGALIPGADPYGQYGAASAPYSATPVVNAQGGMTYTLYVPDSAIPSMVGRGGVIIKEMQQQTGATIKISQKGEYAPGTMNRIVTITGTPQASSWAYRLHTHTHTHIFPFVSLRAHSRPGTLPDNIILCACLSRRLVRAQAEQSVLTNHVPGVDLAAWCKQSFLPCTSLADIESRN